MTRKTRFASSGIILLSLTASLFSLTAQAQVLKSSLDNSVLDYVDFEVTFEVLHNQLHSWIKPGQVLSPALQLTHESFDSLGDTVAATGLPLQAGQAASGLMHGVGDAVLSAGGLLYDIPNEPNPLMPILGHATNGIALNIPAHLISTAEATSPAEMTLRNLDRTVDILFPKRPNYLHLEQPHLVEEIRRISDYEKRIRDAIDSGYVISKTGETINIVSSDAVDILEGIIEQSGLPFGLGEASGSLVHSVGDAIGSASGLLDDATDTHYPLTSALSYVTGGVADAATALLRNDNQLQSPSGLSTNNGLSAPAGHLLAGLTGSLSAVNANSTGVLAPVTVLAEGLLHPISHPSANGSTGAINIVDNSSADQSGLLAPVTGLLGGLLGASR